jgi:hypothetical protein
MSGTQSLLLPQAKVCADKGFFYLSRLLYRAWQTISIPAPKLMDILRIDVPAAPELVIYDIKTTSASIYWTKPAPGKSVERFRVQINGVIGESLVTPPSARRKP